MVICFATAAPPIAGCASGYGALFMCSVEPAAPLRFSASDAVGPALSASWAVAPA
ncbi:hypothetical protein C4K14_3437 [Pseudomonas chlororaphis subsp. aureofaciens]|nr:hypothetical protein C4K14_3437 [Pseudomonas chlororaphis subsp. aureofaciens]